MNVTDNYDYCYLESMHWLLKEKIVHPENVFVGLSYGLEGIECSCFDKPSLSFCMHSQDLFYDAHNIVNILKNDTDHSVKNLVFALGYYSFHYDLSQTIFRQRCIDIYYPLFNTTHNLYADEETLKESASRVSDPDFIRDYHAFFQKNPAYFGEYAKREVEQNAVVAKGGWNNITEEERMEFAQNRAILQNKHLKHVESLKENVGLFYKMCNILTHSGIRIYVLIMPFTEEYLQCIDSEYKKIIYGILEELPFEINYIDFNDEHCMAVEDFLDQDHLTDAGARKLSGIINNILLQTT